MSKSLWGNFSTVNSKVQVDSRANWLGFVGGRSKKQHCNSWTDIIYQSFYIACILMVGEWADINQIWNVFIKFNILSFLLDGDVNEKHNYFMFSWKKKYFFLMLLIDYSNFIFEMTWRKIADAEEVIKKMFVISHLMSCLLLRIFLFLYSFYPEFYKEP